MGAEPQNSFKRVAQRPPIGQIDRKALQIKVLCVTKLILYDCVSVCLSL